MFENFIKHSWWKGIIIAFQAIGPGSSPGECIPFYNHCDPNSFWLRYGLEAARAERAFFSLQNRREQSEKHMKLTHIEWVIPMWSCLIFALLAIVFVYQRPGSLLGAAMYRRASTYASNTADNWKNHPFCFVVLKISEESRNSSFLRSRELHPFSSTRTSQTHYYLQPRQTKRIRKRRASL